MVTSLDIAETFGKDHKNVLKDIRELECSEEFGRLNFEQTFYTVIYKSIFGKDAKHLREEYGISKPDERRNFFSPEELQQVQKAERK